MLNVSYNDAMPEFSHAEWISLGSLVASCLALLIAWRSQSNSSEALRLSKKDHEEKSKSIKVYLVRAIRMQLPNETTFASFALTYTNCASVPNTISKITLVIFYADELGVLREIHVESHTSIIPSIPDNNMGSLSIPINFLGRSTMNGWISFKLSPAILDKLIDRYEVVGLTSNSERIVVASYLLMDTYYGQDKKV
jgi:hypothetical protein